MFALGCIQSLSCHTDRCPTGVTTQDPTRNRALVVPHKTDRVYNYHHATLHALAELIAAAGLDHPQDIRPIHFSHRTSTTDVLSFTRMYPALRPQRAGRWHWRQALSRCLGDGAGGLFLPAALERSAYICTPSREASERAWSLPTPGIAASLRYNGACRSELAVQSA